MLQYPLLNRYIPLSAISLLFLLTWTFHLAAQNSSTLILPQLDSFIQESRALTGQRDFEAAFALNARAFALSKECCGEESAAYAAACFNEGRIHHIKGDYRTAVEWYVPSMRIRKRVLGDLHEDYGKSLNNLAVAYKKLGRFESAEPLYKGALRVRRELFGEKSVPFAATLGNLAILYRELGNYEDAETLNLRALAIREEVLGKEHPHYIRNLLNLGAFYYSIDQLDKAENYYLQVKDFYEASGETEDIDYLKCLDNLGLVYLEKYDYDLAESFYLEALQKVKIEPGKDSELCIIINNHLGLLYLETKTFDKGKYHFTTALNTLELLEMKNHHWYGFYQQNLGDLFYEMGAYEKAKQEQIASLAILLNSLGGNHRRYREGLRELVQTQLALGEFKPAADHLRMLAKVSRLPLHNAIRHLSENEMAQYAEDFRANLDFYFSLAAHYPEVADLCFDEILLHRGFLLKQAVRVNQFNPTDSLEQEYLEQLRGVHRQLAAQYAAPVAERSELADLEARAEQLEKLLTRGLAKAENVEEDVRWPSIQAALEEGEAVIEFVYYADRLETSDEQYGVLLLTPKLNAPLFLPLCTATELNRLLQRNNRSGPAYINELYAYDGQGRQLYELIWQPLAERLAKFPELHSLYVVKAGDLHQLNLSALPVAANKILSDLYHMSLLTSSRDLLDKKAPSETATPLAILFGAIDYDNVSASTIPDNISAAALGMNRGGSFQSDPSLVGTPWRPLPWTEVEIINAQDQLKPAGFRVMSQTNQQATESSFKALGKATDDRKSPRLLHLATHGYFFPSPNEQMATSANHRIAAAQHPMIRSGLILAGANAAWTGTGRANKAAEDGILTAYEISHLDLSDTELVILSACETGLGDVQTFEGVYGLQRAFQIAGSQHLLMTLWQVSDFETQFFMELFYRFWLTEKKEISTAFQAAQLEMRKTYPDPFYWAGFVLLE